MLEDSIYTKMHFRLLYLVIGILLYNHSSGQQLVSRGKNISSSSYQSKNPRSWTADRAVDGDTDRAPDRCDCCAGTNEERNPWFILDLGRQFKIHQIVVWGRGGPGDGGNPVGYGQSLKNLEIKLGTTKYNAQVLTRNRNRVYTYNYTLSTPKEGRYLTLTLRDTHQFFIICELFVYAECNHGYFGNDCGQRCNCFNSPCDKVSGICPSGGCLEGYMGEKCDKLCRNGFYGKGCAEICGHCLNNEVCDHVNGNCTRCAAGYKGVDCKKVCRNGLYGSKCAEICGHCFNNEVCDHIDGHCTKCAAGYKGSDCKTECENGTFGFGCNEQCGKCLQGETCNKKNGTCNKCEPGYTDLLCKVLQNAELKSQYPEVNMYQLALAIAGTIAIVSIIGHVVIAICYVIRRRRKQRSRPIDFPPDISGPYELANRDDCGTEHQYGQTAPVYEEPEALYETPQ